MLIIFTSSIEGFRGELRCGEVRRLCCFLGKSEKERKGLEGRGRMRESNCIDIGE